MKRTSRVLAVLCALASVSPIAQVKESPPISEWRTFTGTWSAVGERKTIPTERNAPAAIVQLSGTVLLTAGEGLSRGFRAEAIGFDDGGTGSGSAGRAVWTDDQGDRIFSVLAGDSVRTGGRVTGTITGGTGRYASVTGEYTFTWQYIQAAEDTTIQGRAANLAGRIRRTETPR